MKGQAREVVLLTGDSNPPIIGGSLLLRPVWDVSGTAAPNRQGSQEFQAARRAQRSYLSSQQTTGLRSRDLGRTSIMRRWPDVPAGIPNHA